MQLSQPVQVRQHPTVHRLLPYKPCFALHAYRYPTFHCHVSHMDMHAQPPQTHRYEPRQCPPFHLGDRNERRAHTPAAPPSHLTATMPQGSRYGSVCRTGDMTDPRDLPRKLRPHLLTHHTSSSSTCNGMRQQLGYHYFTTTTRCSFS